MSSSSAASSSSSSCAYSSSSFSSFSHYQLVSRSPHPLRHRIRVESSVVVQSGWEETRMRNSGKIGRRKNGWDWNDPFRFDRLVWGFGWEQEGAKEKGVYGNGWRMQKRVGFGSWGASAELKMPFESQCICRTQFIWVERLGISLILGFLERIWKMLCKRL